jgi:pimeloyl-ACP methyl ester carboxylesterase
METSIIKEQASFMRAFKTWVMRFLLGGLLIVSIIFGVAIAGWVFFLTARPTNWLGPWSVGVMVTLAALAQVIVMSGAAWFVAGKLNIARRRAFTGIFTGAVMVMMVLLVNFFLQQPLTVPRSILQPRADTQYWNLPTGSRLAYTHLVAEGQPRPTPVIFLHGGPGSPLRSPDYEFYGQFTHYGFDVYLYDQTGTGLSERLANVREYTTQRHVADLEAIRQQIGADQMILIGQSWGATLAADYLAAYPQHVAKVIFSSPGAIWDGGRFKVDYSHTAKTPGPDPKLPLPRVLMAIALIGHNPDAALWLASEQEITDSLDSMPSTKLLNQNYCAADGAKVPNIEIRGQNQYVNRVTLASQATYPDPRPALRSASTPALILHGECDFIPLAVAREYEETLPEATLIQIPAAGHALFGAQPDLVLQLISAFLTDAPLPTVPISNSQ